MRLIDTGTLEIKEHLDENVPPYAILSHRWQDEEVTYEDMISNRARGKRGFDKLEKFCLEAAARSLQYAWADTCCIDKSSSAELSEAINSMYRWYQNAKECYVYLCDVDEDDVRECAKTCVHRYEHIYGSLRASEGNNDNTLEENSPDDSTVELEFYDQHMVDRQLVTELMRSSFAGSEWFGRGWTLQELIAPKTLRLYNKQWKFIGDRECCSEVLSLITGIPCDVLEHRRPPTSYPIAIRMSWASSRTTTRVEDRAYSLMGVFDVNMPLLYGEGHKAFRRLQEEIFRLSDDMSFLLSTNTNPSSTWLARSPSSFSYHDATMFEGYALASNSFTRLMSVHWDDSLEWPKNPDHFSNTWSGLVISLTLIPWEPDIYLAPVMRVSSGGASDNARFYCIALRPTERGDRTIFEKTSYRSQLYVELAVRQLDATKSSYHQAWRMAFHRRITILNVASTRLYPSREVFQGTRLSFREWNRGAAAYHEWAPESGNIISRMRSLEQNISIPFKPGVFELFCVVRTMRAGCWWYLCFGLNSNLQPFCLVSSCLPNSKRLSTSEPALMTSNDLKLVLNTRSCLDLTKDSNFRGVIMQGNGQSMSNSWFQDWRFPDDGLSPVDSDTRSYRDLAVRVDTESIDVHAKTYCFKIAVEVRQGLEHGPVLSWYGTFKRKMAELFGEAVIDYLWGIKEIMNNGRVDGWVLLYICVSFVFLIYLDENKIYRVEQGLSRLTNIVERLDMNATQKQP